ncbi:hypothetical protein nbrc107697_08560 [Gordonia crocea]|uniref:Uncharacterized protein n=1 Tax=Gordonia crocea TaxID=589162 RepID=A0A7I9UUK3_9ACTN|nr:hypothetical protein nbrc107697_08560 [Gordonia crocea]
MMAAVSAPMPAGVETGRKMSTDPDDPDEPPEEEPEDPAVRCRFGATIDPAATAATIAGAATQRPTGRRRRGLRANGCFGVMHSSVREVPPFATSGFRGATAL